MDTDLFWKKTQDDGTHVIGLTDAAFDIFGQLWSIIPVNERKRNYVAGDAIVAVEGTDSLGSLKLPFTVKRISFNGDALERPDELDSSKALFYAEV
jgi:glycine cleavage system H lipoate-binding protein